MKRKFRTSQIALYSVLGFLILLTIVLSISILKGNLLAYQSKASHVLDDEYRVVKNLSLRDIEEIEIEGRWIIDLKQSEEWKVEISFPKNTEHLLKHGQRNNRFKLEYDPPGFGSRKYSVAVISIPTLTALALTGKNSLNINKFEGERIDFSITGRNVIKGNGGRFDTLVLSALGNNHVDLESVPTKNAYVNNTGKSKTVLSMDGGKLSGSLTGASILDYYGTTTENSVKVTGKARVNDLD